MGWGASDDDESVQAIRFVLENMPGFLASEQFEILHQELPKNPRLESIKR